MFLSFVFKENLQIRLRVFEDMSNKTVEESSDLPITVKFLRESLGLSDLSELLLRILYHFAFVHFKDLNKKLNTGHFRAIEKENQELAQGSPWILVMKRVMNDRAGKKDFSVIKEKLVNLLNSGQSFEPL